VQKSCVGWHGADQGVAVLFDLGKAANLSKLRFNTAGGGLAHINYPSLQVHVSLDDKSYILAAKLPASSVPPDAEWATRGRQIEVPLKEVKGVGEIHTSGTSGVD